MFEILNILLKRAVDFLFKQIYKFKYLIYKFENFKYKGW